MRSLINKGKKIMLFIKKPLVDWAKMKNDEESFCGETNGETL